MRVHLPLEDLYDPSLIYMHWDFCEPPVGFAVPQVEVPPIGSDRDSGRDTHFTTLFMWSTAPL